MRKTLNVSISQGRNFGESGQRGYYGGCQWRMLRFRLRVPDLTVARK